MPIVHIIATGGTFDKTYDVLREKMVFDGRSCIPSILDASYARRTTWESIMQVDSLDMRDAHRTAIVAAIERADTERIVLVHGTTRLVDTGKYLSPLFQHHTIVITGALKPFKYSETEAAFNLGCALSAARLLGHGTFVAMHGNVIPIERAEKNPETGLFECHVRDDDA